MTDKEMREALFKAFDSFVNKQGSKIATDSITNNMFDAFQAAYQLQQRRVEELENIIRGIMYDNYDYVPDMHDKISDIVSSDTNKG